MTFATARGGEPFTRLRVLFSALSVVIASVVVGVLATHPVGVLLIPGVLAAGVAVVASRTSYIAALPLLPALLLPTAAMSRTHVGGIPLVFLAVVASFGALAIARAVQLNAANASLPRANRWAVTALAVTAAFSVLGAISSGFSLQPTLALLAAWGVAFFAGAWLTETIQSLRAVVVVLSLCALLALVEFASSSNPYLEIIGPVMFGDGRSGGLVRASATFGAPIVAGATFAIGAFLALSVSGRRAAPLGLLIAGGALATVSRSAMIAMAVGLVVYALSARARIGRAAVAAVLVAAVAAIAYTNSAAFKSTVDGRVVSQSYSENTRESGLDQFANTISTDPAQLILGGGLRSLQNSIKERGGNFGFSTVDNQWITIVYDVGIIGALLTLICWGAALRTAAPDRRSLLTAPLIVGAVTMFFFDALYWPATAALFLFLLGAATSRIALRDQND